MSTLSLHTYREPESVRVEVSGELDLSSALVFEEELRRIEEQSQPSLLVLDLRSLKFMDSTGLRLILSAHARAINRGRKLAIVEGGEAIRRSSSSNVSALERSSSPLTATRTESDS